MTSCAAIWISGCASMQRWKRYKSEVRGQRLEIRVQPGVGRRSRLISRKQISAWTLLVPIFFGIILMFVVALPAAAQVTYGDLQMGMSGDLETGYDGSISKPGGSSHGLGLGGNLRAEGKEGGVVEGPLQIAIATDWVWAAMAICRVLSTPPTSFPSARSPTTAGRKPTPTQRRCSTQVATTGMSTFSRGAIFRAASASTRCGTPREFLGFPARPD